VDEFVCRNNLGLAHIAYTGMGYVSLLADSEFSEEASKERLMFEINHSFGKFYVLYM